MAEIRAFRGIRYDSTSVEDLNQVITPPYDVIDAALQEELYARDPYNVIRLDLGKIRVGDDEQNNRYTRARSQFIAWLREGVLGQDAHAALYYLEEDYPDDAGRLRTRRGVVASVRVEDPDSGLYRPHEKTLAKPKEDRIRLTRACQANLSPIFSLYDDPEMEVSAEVERVARATAPAAAVVDGGGVVTRMWCVTDPAAVGAVTRGMRGKSFFIADGHHRYETALAYRDWRREHCPSFSGEEPWNYVMMYLSNMRDPGLTIFPTHRAVFGLENLDLSHFLDRCAEHFLVERISEAAALLTRVSDRTGDRQHFGLCAKGEPGGWLLRLRKEAPVSQLLGPDLPEVLHDLDVTILHSILLKRVLGISEEAQAEQLNLRYVKGGHELLSAVANNPELQIGFLLNPTRIDQVKAVAEAGQRMPQKSTFFYPKLVTGLVIHPLFTDLQELSGG